MNWRETLFSFRGRVRRTTYWIVVVLSSVVIIVGSFADKANGYELIDGPISITLQLVLSWPLLAISVKRFHDIDKSGWWVLVNIIPIVGGICSMVMNGFIRGTAGENAYGPDPHAQEA